MKIEIIDKKQVYVFPHKRTAMYPVNAFMEDYTIILDNYVKIIKSFLKKHNYKKINFVITGTSGACLYGMLFEKLSNKPLPVTSTLIRKSVTDHHNDSLISSKYYMKYEEYLNIFLDDFIHTGETIERVQKTFEQADQKCKIEGVLIINGKNHLNKISEIFPDWQFTSHMEW